MADTRPPARRGLVVTTAALLLSAITLWASSKLAWIELSPGGDLDSTVTGADLAGWLLPLAVLALAAVAATVALPGLVRRALGAGLAVAGAIALWLILSGSPYDTYQPVGQPERTLTGPAVAVVGGLLLLVAGGLLVWRGHRMPRLGAKYSAPGAKPRATDPDDEMWRALSEGEDPTSGS